MNNEGNTEREYCMFASEPYLTKDAVGRYVILRDETIFSASVKGEGIDQLYFTEALVNPRPSKKEIFKYKLKGAVKGNTFLTGRPTADS